MDKKISQLTALTGANTAVDDVLAIVDTNVPETKKIRVDELFKSVPTGTVSAPAVAPQSDPNTGIFFPAADTIAFAEGGAEAMRIDSSGNVMVGTTSITSGAKFQVDNPSANVILSVGKDIPISLFSRFNDEPAIYWKSGQVLRFATTTDGVSVTGFSELMRITSAGNVGIGTSSPAAKLNVVGNSSNAIAIFDKGAANQAYTQIKNSSISYNTYVDINNNGGNIWALYDATNNQSMAFYTPGASGLWQFFTNGSERMRITSAGDVGIGTNSPTSFASKTLEVYGSSTATLKLTNATTGTGNTAGHELESNGNDITIVNRTSTGYTRFFNNGSERMRITSAGDVLIGQTSSAYASSGRGLISINGTSEAFVGFNTGGNFKGYIQHDGTNFTQENQTSTGYIRWVTNSAERARITSDGELLIGTTTDNGAYLLQVNSQIYATNATIATSDARLKENVEPITNALSTIEKVKAVTFDFKQGTNYNFDTVKQTGFIAQDLQVALSSESYKDSIVKECGEYLGVAYEKMVPVLVAAIQELKAEVDALKAELANK